MTDNTLRIIEIAKNFKFEGSFEEVKTNRSGHINDTYMLDYRDGDKLNKYVMQRINHEVFKEPEKLMENFSGITKFMQDKIIKAGGDPLRETINLVYRQDGKSFVKLKDGSYWRSYTYIDGARAYETVANREHFYMAGKAFGDFQRMLSDYPADMLHDTIPNFHHTAKRLEAFKEAVERDALGRAKDVKEDIDFYLSRERYAPILVDLLESGDLPLRVTHNDTKFNNVLIDDETGEGICVIDLDTVMPGLSLYDFGDAIRYGASSAEEDEVDLSKVWMDIDLYERFTRGFLETAGASLTKTELDHLAFSAKLMTYECGMRFLTDHLNGDVYFKIQRPNHNLDRSRTQQKLVEDMEAKMEEMKSIVEKCMIDF